ncbi:MAG: GAF domain-containing protein [Candidatus Zixiibacteriota bacterium]
MSFPYMDVGIFALFLTAFIVVYNIEKPLRQGAFSAFSGMGRGIAVLSAVAFVSMLNSFGLFDDIPFLSEEMFFRLIVWIGVAGGLMLMLSGSLSWWPSNAKSASNRKEPMTGMEFVKKAQQLASLESDVPVLIERILGNTIELFEVQTAAAYLLSPKRHGMPLVAATGISFVSREELGHIEFDTEAVLKAANEDVVSAETVIHLVPSRISFPDMILPMTVNNRVAGVIALWKNPAATWSDEDKVNLRLTADVLARKIQSEQERLRESFRDACERMSVRLGGVVDSRSGLKENFARAAHVVRELTGTEKLCLLINSPETGMVRLLSGESGAVLEERGSIAKMHSTSLQVLTAIPQGEWLGAQQNDTHSIARSIGATNAVHVMIEGKGSATAALIAGSASTNGMRARTIELLKVAAPSFDIMIRDEQARFRTRALTVRMGALERLVDQTRPNGNLISLFRACMTTLVEQMQLHASAMSTVDRDAAHLCVRSVVGSAMKRNLGEWSPLRLDLANLRAHQVAADTGLLIHSRIGGEEPSMQEEESRKLAVDGSKAITIVPVKIRGQVLALVTLGHSSPLTELSEEDTAFINAVVAVLGSAIETTLAVTALSKSRQQITYPAIVADAEPAKEDMFKGRMKSALSGILGSMERIRTSNSDLDESTRRYLGIIEKSAGRMRAYMEDDIPVEV